MEKRKSKRCPTVSGEISPLRFFKNEIALSEFFGGTERIRVSAVLQKKGEAEGADKRRGKTGEQEQPIRKRKGGARAGEKIGLRRAEKMRKTRENRAGERESKEEEGRIRSRGAKKRKRQNNMQAI